MRLAYVAAAALAFLAALPGPASAAEKGKDIIITTDGKSKEVTAVLEENFAHCRFRIGTQEQKIKITDVKQVVYYDAPEDFTEAMGLFGSKKYVEALGGFEKAKDASGVRDWIKQYALFYQAECNRKIGKASKANYKTAVEKYNELLTAVPGTKFFAEAMFYIGESLANLGDYDQAVAAYRKLQTEVSNKALEPKWAMEADIAEGRVLETKKDYVAAFHKYTSIHTSATRQGLKDIASMALLRQGLCMLAQDKAAEAEKFFNDIYNSATGEGPDMRVVKGGACIGLGRCYLKANDPRKASFWFLKCVVVYFTSEEFHPQALYYAGLCFHQLKKTDPPSAAQAKALFADLSRRYPESDLAKEAKKLGY